jgi:hypothetical protein
VVVTAAAVGLADATGRVCGPVRPDIPQIRGFRIPSAWAGRLFVIWSVFSTSKDGTPIGEEAEGAVLGLSGSQSACSLLLASGSSIP